MGQIISMFWKPTAPQEDTQNFIPKDCWNRLFSLENPLSLNHWNNLLLCSDTAYTSPMKTENGKEYCIMFTSLSPEEKLQLHEQIKQGKSLVLGCDEYHLGGSELQHYLNFQLPIEKICSIFLIKGGGIFCPDSTFEIKTSALVFATTSKPNACPAHYRPAWMGSTNVTENAQPKMKP
jgi:hypothetical protein